MIKISASAELTKGIYNATILPYLNWGYCVNLMAFQRYALSGGFKVLDNSMNGGAQGTFEPKTFDEVHLTE